MKIFSFFRTQRGFSMIELIIVFSLLAVVTGVGFFSFIDFSRVQEVDQGSKDVASFYGEARAKASSFIKPSVCGDGTLHAYRVDYCPNADCQGQETYEMSVLCGEQEHVIETLSLTDQITHDSESDCVSVSYTVPRGVAEGSLPCSQILDRSGERETVTVDMNGHVVFGEEGRLASEATPTPSPTPVDEDPDEPDPRGGDGGTGGDDPETNPCQPNETYLTWDVGTQDDVVMCESKYTKQLFAQRGEGVCTTNEKTIVWASNDVGTPIRVCVNRLNAVASFTSTSSCPSTYQTLTTWLSGAGDDTQVQACASSSDGNGSIRVIWAPQQTTGGTR